MMIWGFARWAQSLLFRPMRVFIICLMLVIFGLLFDGTFIRIWDLSIEKARLQRSIENLMTVNHGVHQQIERVKDPRYIERLARDRFDWAARDELIFVFDDDLDTSE